MDSRSVRGLKLSRFPWFLGWARFQSTCHSGLSRNLWSKLGPGMCRITVNVLCYSSKLTDNTENEQRNSPLPSAPIWTTEHLREFAGLFMDLWLRETNFGRVIMIGNKSNLIWCYSSGQQLQNERSLSRYLICWLSELSVSLSVGVCDHIVIVARTLAPCCVNIITALLT